MRQDLGLPLDAWMADLSTDGTKVLFVTSSIWLGFCGACVEDQLRPALIPVGKASGSYVYARYPAEVDMGEIRQPALSPDEQTFAFQGVDPHDGNEDIYVARMLPGSSPGFTPAVVFRLTTDPAVDEFPAWSPDGTTIFYSNAGRTLQDDSGLSPTQEIWSVPAFGGPPTRLTDNDVPETQPDVSAADRVAYWRDGEIWSMDLDGDGQHRLDTVAPGTGFNPRWSPDGSRLALLRYDPSDRAAADPAMGRYTSLPLLEAVVVELATGTVSVVGPRVASYVNPPSWVPDGSALLINRYDAGR